LTESLDALDTTFTYDMVLNSAYMSTDNEFEGHTHTPALSATIAITLKRDDETFWANQKLGNP